MSTPREENCVNVTSEISRKEVVWKRLTRVVHVKTNSVGVQVNGSVIKRSPIKALVNGSREELSVTRGATHVSQEQANNGRLPAFSTSTAIIILGFAIIVTMIINHRIYISETNKMCMKHKEEIYYRVESILRKEVQNLIVQSEISNPTQDNSKELTTELDSCHQNYRHLFKDLLSMKMNNLQMSNSVKSTMRKLDTFVKTTKQMIYDEINIYNADKLGLADYALESLGGRIISTYDTETVDLKAWITVFNMPIIPIVTHHPRNIIQSSVQPGHCWCFKGSTGKVRIQLYRPIYITAVTLEHISPLISPDGQITSAPETFAIVGVAPSKDNNEEMQILLGSFTYSASGKPWQTFKTSYPDNYHGPLQIIEMWILTNHGHDKNTCVYRLRVHGVTEENKNQDNHVFN